MGTRYFNTSGGEIERPERFSPEEVAAQRIHHFEPDYSLSCGDNSGVILFQGHGASIDWNAVTCEKCLEMHKSD